MHKCRDLLSVAPFIRCTRNGPGRTIMLERLTHALATRRRFTQTRPRQAAILLPLIGSNENLSLLLTRRASGMSSHANQVAYPGGVCDAVDGGLPVKTALREANEEVGLTPSDASILGMLDDLPSFKNDMAVTPVVARLEPHLTIRDFCASEAEVARIFSIPLGELVVEERWCTTHSEWRDQPITQYSFEHDGERLWGLSAYATLMLLALAAPGSAPAIPWFKLDGRARSTTESDHEPFG